MGLAKADPAEMAACLNQAAEAAFEQALLGEPAKALELASLALRLEEKCAAQAAGPGIADPLCILGRAELAASLSMVELQLPAASRAEVAANKLLSLVESSAIVALITAPAASGLPCRPADLARLSYCALAVLKLLRVRRAAELERARLMLESLTGCLLPLEPMHFIRQPRAQMEHWAYWDFEIAKLLHTAGSRLSDYHTAHDRRLHYYCRVESPGAALLCCWEREAESLSRGLRLLDSSSAGQDSGSKRGRYAGR